MLNSVQCIIDLIDNNMCIYIYSHTIDCILYVIYHSLDSIYCVVYDVYYIKNKRVCNIYIILCIVLN